MEPAVLAVPARLAMELAVLVVPARLAMELAVLVVPARLAMELAVHEMERVLHEMLFCLACERTCCDMCY